MKAEIKLVSLDLNPRMREALSSPAAFSKSPDHAEEACKRVSMAFPKDEPILRSPEIDQITASLKEIVLSPKCTDEKSLDHAIQLVARLAPEWVLEKFVSNKFNYPKIEHWFANAYLRQAQLTYNEDHFIAASHAIHKLAENPSEESQTKAAHLLNQIGRHTTGVLDEWGLDYFSKFAKCALELVFQDNTKIVDSLKVGLAVISGRYSEQTIKAKIIPLAIDAVTTELLDGKPALTKSLVEQAINFCHIQDVRDSLNNLKGRLETRHREYLRMINGGITRADELAANPAPAASIAKLDFVGITVEGRILGRSTR